jgi:hypothetical protein
LFHHAAENAPSEDQKLNSVRYLKAIVDRFQLQSEMLAKGAQSAMNLDFQQ